MFKYKGKQEGDIGGKVQKGGKRGRLKYRKHIGKDTRKDGIHGSSYSEGVML